METPQSFREALRPLDWVTSIDLTDAYFHLLIRQSFRKWLRFVWEENIYQFRALPFGLSLSPWVFTKVVRELLAVVHSNEVRMRAYLDDWAVLAASHAQAARDTELVLSLARELGFNVNLLKSELEPSQRFLYLGLVFDTVAWTVAPSQARVDRLLASIESLLFLSSASARQVAKVLGSMESMVPFVPTAGALKRPLQRGFRERWSQAQGSWEDPVALGQWFARAVSPWRRRDFLLAGVPITEPPPEVELFTDASHAGWGAHALGRTASGVWESDVSTLHINILEMRAVFLALKALAPYWSAGLIRIRSDNSTVIAYINHQGGTVSQSLSLLAEEIVLWAFERNFTLSAVHVKGKANVLADFLSRPGAVVQTEWTLAHQTLSQVWEAFGKPHIDLFATRYSARLQIFVSPVPDPQAWAVDALSISWIGLDAYAFPPFPLIPRVLRKWREDQPRLILIAPDWPAQGWFPDLISLCHTKLPLVVRNTSLLQPRSGILHSNPGMLQLTAWLLLPQACPRPALPPSLSL